MSEYNEFTENKLKAARDMGMIKLTSDADTQMEGQENPMPKNDNETPSIHKNNQKIGLLNGLLRIGAIDQAITLFDLLSPITPQVNPTVSSSLMHAIHALIRPIYDMFSPREYKQPSTDKPTFTEEHSHVLDNLITPLLIRLDYWLYRDTFLFAYVLRVFSNYFESNPHNPHVEAVMRILLCALYFCENNVGLSYETWNLLKQLSLTAQYNLVSLDTKQMLKRLAKDGQRQQGRNLSKLTHSGGLCLVVDSFRYVTHMFHDMLSFELLHSFKADASHQLKTPRSKNGDASVSNWLVNLSTLTGMLFKKYSHSIQDDLDPLLHFLINRTYDAHWEDFSLLKQLIHHMTGLDSNEDLKDEQLEAHAGNPFSVGTSSITTDEELEAQQESLLQFWRTFNREVPEQVKQIQLKKAEKRSLRKKVSVHKAGDIVMWRNPRTIPKHGKTYKVHSKCSAKLMLLDTTFFKVWTKDVFEVRLQLFFLMPKHCLPPACEVTSFHRSKFIFVL
ncbi:THO complex subunit [Acrasis kona]|uniref:THO complex subunit n=1 Tax=Acrasis kona TaxID=1008807 RepID=A0AAW2YHS8_9EUKA